MKWKNYEINDIVLKTTDLAELWRTEKGFLEVGKDTLTASVKLEGEEKGLVFHGNGKLLIDTIVETSEGAIGKSVERQLNEPFIMLGSLENKEKILSNASDNDLKEQGFANSEEFMTQVDDLCNLFFDEKFHNHENGYNISGQIFAFPNNDETFDILVAKKSKIVYKSKGKVFVSKGDKTVLKSPDEVVVSHNGKSVIVTKDKSIIIKS